MIVSHEHRFVYVRTRKTGSTSLEIALSRVCGSEDVITSFCGRDEALRLRSGGRPPQNVVERNGVVPFNHMSATDIRRHVGPEVWDEYFTFTVERHPWEKVVSLYFHRYKDPRERPGIDAFLESGESADARNWPLYTREGRVVVDFVGSYDRMPDVVASVGERLGVTLGAMPGAKSQFRQDRRPAADILTGAQKAIVLRQFVGEPLPFDGRIGLSYEDGETC